MGMTSGSPSFSTSSAIVSPAAIQMLLSLHLLVASYVPAHHVPAPRATLAHSNCNSRTSVTEMQALDVVPASARELITSEEVLRLAHEARDHPTLLLFGQRACRACRTLQPSLQ